MTLESMDWGLYVGVVTASIVVGVAILWIVGGYYHVRYYRRRRHEPETWKIQPKRFPSDKMQRKAMRLATFNLAFAGFFSGHFVYAIMAGYNPSAIYFEVADYGWVWTIAGTAVLFFLIDAAAYYVHRLLHVRFFYRRVHYLHHKWGAPSPWVVTALHPVEMVMLQGATFLPIFIIPFHYVSVIAVFIYVLIFNIIDHSGVRLTSIWPWQGPSMFHDDHHVHFHVNFGQHLTFFDRIHGTLRRKNRKYGSKNFGGKGAPADDEAPGAFVDY